MKKIQKNVKKMKFIFQLVCLAQLQKLTLLLVMKHQKLIQLIK